MDAERPSHVAPTESDALQTTPTVSSTPSLTPTERNAQSIAPPTTTDLASILDVMRTMMVDRERREREIVEERQKQDAERELERQKQEALRVEERRRYEEESERRIAAMNKQMEMLQSVVLGHADKDAKRDSDSIKLTRLTEADDIESYLTTFERMMKAYEVDTTRWAFKLAPQLTGRAQQAYAALDPSDAECYTTVKAAILRRYNINAETYRQRFRSFKNKAGQTPTEIATRLTDLASRWLKDCSTAEEVQDAVVKEQLLATFPEDIRMWVKERKLKTTTEAAQLAEDYLQARPAGTSKHERLPTGPCPRCGEYGHWARYCPTNPKPENPMHPKAHGSRQQQTRHSEQSGESKGQHTHGGKTSERGSRTSDTVKCYTCHEKGHLSYNCPQKALFSNEAPAETRKLQQERAYRRGVINGVYCMDIVVDTGANKTLVRGDLVTPDDIIDGEVTIQCAHGDSVSYPLAAVKIKLEGKDIITHAAVAKSLPVAALLGWDVPELRELINPTLDGEREGTANALAVVTRRQKKNQDTMPVATDPSVISNETTMDPVRSTENEDPNSTAEDPLVTTVDDAESSQEAIETPTEHDTACTIEFDIDDSLFSPPGPDKQMLTRSQKRATRRQYRTPDVNEALPESFQSLNISAEQIRTLQQEDPTLEHARQIAEGECSAIAGWKFFKRDGLLYRRYHKPGNSDTSTGVEQLVLPTTCRQPVMQLAHDIPMAGHLGRRKTAERILQRFYWPGIYRDVRDHCRSCEKCQKSSPRGIRRAPLIPLPIIDTPFKRIAMDIVGPLPRSTSGKRFILVICDYGPRYPEAIALRSIDAHRIAKELISFFARVGVPEEILTDQGTNFTSQLLQEVYRLLRIKNNALPPSDRRSRRAIQPHA